MEQFYTDLCFRISRLVTRAYSTSFSVAVGRLPKETREGIYSIYGFVRFADEIVDSFHGHEKEYLLEKFRSDYYDALKTGISLNPVLHSFTRTVRLYNIDDELVISFLDSMRTDLTKKEFKSPEEIGRYIYGSAEVVGLMCLKVFLNGDEKEYEKLSDPARKLGSAFQKVNFLRDLRSDIEVLGRKYFPQMAGRDFSDDVKNLIINDILSDFEDSYKGLVKLPPAARVGVLVAYRYYSVLLNKIRRTPASILAERRIRISNARKILLLADAVVRNRLNLV